MSENPSLKLTIAQKDYRLKLPASEHEALKDIAHRLNVGIHNLKAKHPSLVGERAIAMAALNLCHEQTESSNATLEYQELMDNTLIALRQKIDSYFSS